MQRGLIAWYRENGQVIQAATLASEWLITAVGHRLGVGYALERSQRRAVERAITAQVRIGREAERAEEWGL